MSANLPDTIVILEKMLWDAAYNGDAGMLKRYLDGGANVNYKNTEQVILNFKHASYMQRYSLLKYVIIVIHMLILLFRSIYIVCFC